MILDLRRQDRGVREIARRLSHSTDAISKELTRNRDEFGVYLSSYIHRKSVLHRFRPKQYKSDTNLKLHEAVQMILKGKYSLEQVSRRLCKEYPDDGTIHVSPETIYQSLLLQAKDELKEEVAAALHRGQTQREPRDQRVPRRRFVNPMVMTSDRPAEINDRAVLGHWEGDLTLGKGNNSAIDTLVGRTT